LPLRYSGALPVWGLSSGARRAFEIHTAPELCAYHCKSTSSAQNPPDTDPEAYTCGVENMNNGLPRWALPLFVLLASGLTPLAQAQARVQIHVSNNFGDSGQARRITMTKISETGEPGKTSDVRQDEVLTVAFGQYIIEVEASGSKKETQYVTIDQLDQIIPIRMRIGALEGPPPECSVKGHVPAATARVRLIELYGTYLADVAVKAGSFEFWGLECGEYLLIAMGPKECLATVTFRATPAHYQIDIPPPASSNTPCTSAGK
jgi:hypothetical protein